MVDADSGRARPGTYSISARDRESAELGVAVQSHWFSVGSVVPWARPGVGAVATQANADISYGPEALARLEQGAGAGAALAELVRRDPGAETRQVGVVDADGGVAVHTGARCIEFAGHAIGDGVCCQANIMASDRVWPAMLAAFADAQGALAIRMLAALEAAEAAGGDIRGRQSAALLVVPGAGEPRETIVTLRVEDHPEPLEEELRRLLGLHDAYAVAAQGDWLVGEGRLDDAARRYQQASELAPDSHELLFWSGLGAAHAGDVDAGSRQVRAAIAREPGWAELLGRLSDDAAPGTSTVRERLGIVAEPQSPSR